MKRYNKIVNALILGFITGSLGIVWPWKKTVYLAENDTLLLDQKGNRIIENYERYFPDILSYETFFAVLCAFFGLGLILAIDYYDRKRKK